MMACTTFGYCLAPLPNPRRNRITKIGNEEDIIDYGKFRVGGAERQICGLASLLTKAGYPCRLITYVENQFYEPFLRQNGVDYQFVPELWNHNTRVIRAAKYVRHYKPDVVISFLPSVNKTMCLAKLLFKAKLVVSERNNNTCVTRADKVQFNLYRMADAIVPNSNSQGRLSAVIFRSSAKRCTPSSILWM